MSKDKRIILTPRKYKEMEHDAINKAMVLVCAALWDMKDFSAEDCLKFASYFQSYLDNIEQNKYQVKHVAEILKEELGLIVDLTK